MELKFRYDEENGTAYFRFNDRKIKGSVESDDELFLFDLDEENRLAGLEILSVRRLMETVEEAQQIESAVREPFQARISSEMLERYVLYAACSRLAAEGLSAG
jgi:uncharacterized protein YuzE